MPRGSRRNATVGGILEIAQTSLGNSMRRSTLTNRHPGLLGSAREEALRDVLREYLPADLHVGTGQVVDHANTFSAQVDVIVYDGNKNPVFQRTPHLLLPAEAVLAVAEVKSELNAESLRQAIANAERLRTLRPYGGTLVGARLGGKKVAKDSSRILYSILAYTTNLADGDDWIDREWARVSAVLPKNARDVVDYILVLDRGLISVPFQAGKQSSGDDTFYEWFVGLANFLGREARRRRPLDWQLYSDAYSRGWRRLV